MHPVLDAIQQFRVDVKPADVEAVTVETYPSAAELTVTRPSNALQAKFSIPFAVATALLMSETWPAAFDEEAITPEAIALAEQVTVTVDNEYAARVPEQRGARVTVDLGDELVSHEVSTPRGGEYDPFSEGKFHEKFHSFTSPIIDSGRADDLWTSARAFEPLRVLCTLAQR